VVRVGRSLGSVAFGWPPEGEEITDIAVAWRASVGLLDGDFEDRSDMSDPAFETRSEATKNSPLDANLYVCMYVCIIS
jgi:hypothetical protein